MYSIPLKSRILPYIVDPGSVMRKTVSETEKRMVRTSGGAAAVRLVFRPGTGAKESRTGLKQGWSRNRLGLRREVCQNHQVAGLCPAR